MPIWEYVLAPFRKRQETTDSQYWAFISYSQKDSDWADWLQSSLETYRVPRRFRRRSGSDGSVGKYLFPIFRDINEQEATADLGAALRADLERSRYLIVICSPRSANSRWVNEEVDFFKALGRGNRILCLIIDGEPNATVDPDECFPIALRSKKDSTAAQPIAADVRKGRDSRHRALVKLVAGILGVRFNTLWRREVRRLIRRTLRDTAASLLVLTLIAMTFVAVADNGVAVPGGEKIRSLLDRYEASVFRPAHSRTAIVRAAETAQDPIVERILREWLNKEWLYSTPNRVVCPETAVSPWISSQAATAVMRVRGSRRDRLNDLLDILEAPFLGGYPIAANGTKFGWCVGDADYPQAHPALWTVAALGAALEKRDLLGEEATNRLLSRLEIAQDVADAYYPVGDGGWNIVPRQNKPGEHATGPTALAFLALMELHHAGLGWHGDRARLDAMLRATAKWLAERFDDRAPVPGWRIQLNVTGSIETGEVADGLTLQIYSQFLRAEEAAGIVVPSAILSSIPRHIEQLIGRPANYANVRSSTARYFTNIDGRPGIADVPESHLWYPWAIDAATRWLRRIERTDAAPEAKVRARRALGYLVVDLGSRNFQAAATPDGSPTFVASETLYALGTITSIEGSIGNPQR